MTRLDYIEPLKPKSLCPRCMYGQRHSKDELRAHHPESGGGYNKEQGWSDNIAEDRRMSGVEPLVIGRQV